MLKQKLKRLIGICVLATVFWGIVLWLLWISLTITPYLIIPNEYLWKFLALEAVIFFCVTACGVYLLEKDRWRK